MFYKFKYIELFYLDRIILISYLINYFNFKKLFNIKINSIIKIYHSCKYSEKLCIRSISLIQKIHIGILFIIN